MGRWQEKLSELYEKPKIQGDRRLVSVLGRCSGQGLILSKPLPLPLGPIFSEWKDRQSPGRFQSTACLQLAGHGIHQQQSKTRSSPADMGRTWICARTHQNKPVLPCLLGRLQLQYLKPEISFKPFGLVRTLECCSLACLLPLSAPSQKNPPPRRPPFPAHTTQKAETDPSLPLQLGLISQNTHM